MNDQVNLQRFVQVQEEIYQAALQEIRQGKKRTHWMWFIFPQIQGLGSSETSRYYAIRDLNEASAFLEHPLLGKRLVEISTVLLQPENKNANRIFGSPDDLKLQSCMTLFAEVPVTNPIFQAVLEKFFGGNKDKKTLAIINHD